MKQMLTYPKISESQESGIKLVGVVNFNGTLVEGNFYNKITPLMTKEQIAMLCMELAIDYSMRKEFDQSLGKTKSIVSIRECYVVTTIPSNDGLLIIISDTYNDSVRYVDKIRKCDKER